MTSWFPLSLVLALTLGAGWPRYARAQAAHRWSSDLAVGGAIVEGGDFLRNGKAAARVSFAGRVLRRERVAAYVDAGYDWVGRFKLLGANPDQVCILRSGGGCAPPYPGVSGPTASIGLLYAPFRWIETRVGAGGAAYSVDGTRVGAAVGQLDAAVFPVARVGLILGARYAAIPRYRHDRLTMIPLVFGLRVR